MSTNSPTNSPSQTAARRPRGAAQVVVAVIAGPDAPPWVGEMRIGQRWRRLTPLAHWSTVAIRDASPEQILHGVAAERARRDVQAGRLILLAEGMAGRAALELVLRGALDCAGIVAIAVPCAALPFRIASTSVPVRIVVQREHGEDAPDDLISALRAADIDARIIRLNPAAVLDPRTAVNAAETFVLELVAHASRQGRHGV